ncbi:hypothetical protein [Microbacterium sp.]|uniref:hypothetical protein n=1 Tax=Microbacterium sp. TaxID=51671 RepID=UPI0025ED1F95|nr:hypothetical protein [Microbacterium sp.]
MISAALAPLNVDVTTSMVAVVTVLAVLVSGLATLAKPSRATIAWGTAYAIGIFGAYLWLGGYQLDDPVMRAGASAILFSFEPLVWWGLRAFAGRRPIWWPVIAFIALGPVLLLGTAGHPAYQVAFRALFLTASVFAGLIVYELIRMKNVDRDITMPLILASATFVLLAVVAVISAFAVDGLTAEQQLGILRGTNSTGAMVMSTCAAFTLILLVRTDAPSRGGWDEQIERSRRRLARAEAQGDDAWSVLDVHLDDQVDLREALSATVFAEVRDRFHADVERSVPAAADIHCIDDGRVIVVIGAGEEAMRHHVPALLSRISSMGEGTAVPGIRVSASVGWATATTFGFDYDMLVAAAHRAADAARAAGGDRWARAERPASASPANLEA